MQFVIQEFRPAGKPDQKRYYLRLDKYGVLQGWAVPKGLPGKGDKQRLAIEVGPIKQEAARFEGGVQKSTFGPGTISIFDQGEYRFHSWTEDRIIFKLSGSRVKGSFALVHFPKGGPRHWLLEQTHNGPDTIPSPIKSPIVGIKPARTASAHRNKPRKTSRQRKMPRPASIPRKKPQRISIHQERPETIYRKPPGIKQLLARRRKIRFPRRNKASFRTGYTAGDWRLLITFILIGLIALVVLVVLINLR